jgi:hypothetical protein
MVDQFRLRLRFDFLNGKIRSIGSDFRKEGGLKIFLGRRVRSDWLSLIGGGTGRRPLAPLWPTRRVRNYGDALLNPQFLGDRDLAAALRRAR